MTKTAERAHDAYIRDKEEGAYSGSPKQITWNHHRKMHECCESKKSIYHKAQCPNRGKYIERRDEKAVDPSFKDQVRALKSEGLTSSEVYEELREMGVETTLGKVNAAYA